VGVRSAFKKLTTPVEELDRARRQQGTAMLGVTPLDQVRPRSIERVAGEVSSVRIVPRSGAPSLEVSIDDGNGRATAVFFGRKHVSGLSPGRTVVFEGRVQQSAHRVILYNPAYELR
jgi:RecG-like helicase